MKVLLQEWRLPNEVTACSISIDAAQLDAVKRSHSALIAGAHADGDPIWVEIPDSHGLAEKVEDDTVFLEEDELEAVTFPLDA